MVKPETTSKAKVKPKTKTNSAAVGIALLFCIVLAFVLAWSRFGTAHQIQSTVAYTSIGPVVMHGRGYAFSVTMAVQTSAADAKWAPQNKKAIGEVLQAALSKVNPHALRVPEGMVALQETLKLTINKAFQTEQVQRVLLTDFILQEDGS